MNEIILTNNSKVNDKYKSKFEIEFIEKVGILISFMKQEI